MLKDKHTLQTKYVYRKYHIIAQVESSSGRLLLRGCIPITSYNIQKYCLFFYLSQAIKLSVTCVVKLRVYVSAGFSDSFAICCQQYTIHLIREKRSLKIGDRILAINVYNVAHFSLSEASVFLQQSGREVSLLVEYGVSLMGEHHRLQTVTQCYLTWCLLPETNVCMY